MRKRHKALMTAAIIAATSFGAGSLLAQEGNQQEPLEGQGMHGNMMQEGGMHGMMGMMNDMMEKCNAMMKKMEQGKENDTNA